MERLAAADGATKCIHSIRYVLEAIAFFFALRAFIRFTFVFFHLRTNVIPNKSCAREFPF